MRIEVTREEELFREEVRDWLHDNVPKDERPTEDVDMGRAMRDFDLAWQKTQYEGGWAGLAWPKEFGGRGLAIDEMLIWHEEYARAHAPRIGTCFVGINHAGPTLIARGTAEQQTFHLPQILRGDHIWCQGFSEPTAGSDLANIKTRAEVDGDHLVVNGSKIWTSYGHLAKYGELLVRTDPDSRKHAGITWTIVDMESPGIEARPISTMTGPDDHHFCQVFYNDVRIPLSNVVGEINGGWSVANTTLGFERGTAFAAEQIHQAMLIENLIDLARRPGPDGRPRIEDGEYASRLAMIRAEMAAMRAMTYRSLNNAKRNNPGSDGSMIRLYFSEAQQRLKRLAMDILGPAGLELSGDEGWTRLYLRSFSVTIAAGSCDIQRNIIGERVLGLPRGPRAQ